MTEIKPLAAAERNRWEKENGARERIRTSDRLVRSQVLYPAELHAHRSVAHPGGLEPPTARFVAGYSIQLSYGCIPNA